MAAAVPSVLCAVTIFQPQIDLLDSLLAALLKQRMHVAVFVDGPTGVAIEKAALLKLKSEPRLKIFQSDLNRGVGHALNSLTTYARMSGFSYILFLDQDSSPPFDLAKRLHFVFSSLLDAGRKPAVVGVNPVDPADGFHSQPPRYRVRDLVSLPQVARVDFVITSGSLMKISTISEVGPFREDYFIDAIDTEWCFRASSKGFESFMARDVRMPHRVGRGRINFGPLKFPLQTEERMLTYLRNQAHSLRLGYVPLRWKLRTALYLPFQSVAWLLVGNGNRRTPRLFLQAIADGLRGRFS